MAVKLSGKSIGLSNKGIGRRKNYIENPVDDVIKASGIRIKSYDGRQIALRRYISREDELLFNELPETQRRKLLEEFVQTKEYSELVNVAEQYRKENDFVYDSITSDHNIKKKNGAGYMYSYNSISLSGDSHLSLSQEEISQETLSEAGSYYNDEVYQEVTDVSYKKSDVSEPQYTGSGAVQEGQTVKAEDTNAVIAVPEDKKRISRIKLSEEPEDDNKPAARKNSGFSGNITMADDTAAKAASEQTDKLTEASITASCGGTSEIVKAAGQAAKKYADMIKQATGDDGPGESAAVTNTSGETNFHPEEKGFIKSAAAIIMTAATAVLTYLGSALMPVIALILCVVVIATVLVSVISSVAGVITNTVNKVSSGIRTYLLSENTISYSDDLREAATDNEILNYVNYLIAIIEVESHGNGNDPMQSSESAGLPPGSFTDPKDSIRQGAYYFAGCLSLANENGCDLMTAVQAYNYGQGFINYVADNGGRYTLELAISFAEKYSGGIQVDYSNSIAVDYNGGWRYAYGNMFYAQLVNQYIYSYKDEAVQKIVDEAMKYYGWEYTWGGSNPEEGFDCSGLVQWCYGTAGIELPRTSREQFDWCEEISVDELKAGDLLFYQNESSVGEIGHVAIYIGDGKVYEAGDPIGVYDNNDNWHQDNLLYAGRIIHFEPEENTE